MVQIQGLKIASTMIALVLAMTTVNTLAAASGLAIQLNANGISTEDIRETTNNAQPEPEGIGSEDPGFFGVATGMTQTFSQIFALTTNLGAMLKSIGVPGVIATSAQLMVDFTIVIGLYQILRAVVF